MAAHQGEPLDGTSCVVDTRRSPHAHLRPVPLTGVTLTDAFWAPRRRVNGEQTLPGQHRHLEATGAIDNFGRAAGARNGGFAGMVFSDSDVYKWLEAVGWHLASGPDDDLRRTAEAVTEVVAAAQRPDGYLHSYFARDRASERWTNFDLHEMYCAGHLFQAAVAMHRGTGATRLLEVAMRFADHICDTFGGRPGQKLAVDGHPEVELGLVELYRSTGVRRYLDQAAFFVEARGQGLLGRPYGHLDPSYAQDHRPFRDLEAVTGHAVRALYLNAGVADLCAETDQPAYRASLERQWASMTGRRMYVSGGVGSRWEGESFGEDFELPHARAYAETCGAIASVMWNWRMLALSADARYADLLEWTLFNAVLPGLSLAGDTYFYQNPLADDGRHRRQPWFGCACCPPNVARLLASLPGYVYAAADRELWVHLFAAGTLDTVLPNGLRVRIEQDTGYPWDGQVTLRLRSAGRFALRVRVPTWCETGASLAVNGVPAVSAPTPGTYACIDHSWQREDRVEIDLPMPVRYLHAHRHVLEAKMRAAIARGPLLYCVEGADNPGLDVRDLVLPANPATLRPAPVDLPGVRVALRGSAGLRHPDDGPLYRSATCTPYAATREAEMVAIPYFAWANRANGRMRVWIDAS